MAAAASAQVAARCRSTAEELARRSGGRLNILGVQELVAGVADLVSARRRWQRLGASSVDDVVTFETGPQVRLRGTAAPGFQELTLDVEWLKRALTFLAQRGMLSQRAGQGLAILPAVVDGLKINLKEAP